MEEIHLRQPHRDRYYGNLKPLLCELQEITRLRVLAVAKSKFVTTISQMDKDKRIMWIPRRYQSKIAEFPDKQVRILRDGDDL
jgi:hypothetical protein